MNNIKRIDFTEGYTNSDGEFIGGMTNEVTVLFNITVISEEEVRELIGSGMYEYDSRIVVTTPIRADNLRSR